MQTDLAKARSTISVYNEDLEKFRQIKAEYEADIEEKTGIPIKLSSARAFAKLMAETLA